jgi:hypothetical protein
MGDFSTFLFANPSFFEGLCRVLDIGGTLTEFNRSRSAAEADLLALHADWLALGEDFRQSRRSVSEVRSESPSQKPN